MFSYPSAMLVTGGRGGSTYFAGLEERSFVAMLLRTDFLAGNLVNNLWLTPRGVSEVWQAKDFKSNTFGSVAKKEVMGEFFESVAKEGVSEKKAGQGLREC